jgi:HNH endonuclease
MIAHCAIHNRHQDEPESFDRHHIVPESWGGPTKASNLATLCPTGHRDVHTLLNLLVMGGGQLQSWVKWRHWNSATRALAKKGYDDALAMGLTPKTT